MDPIGWSPITKSFPVSVGVVSGNQILFYGTAITVGISDHELRDGITNIVVKKDAAPNQTTQSFLHVLFQFLFVRKVENVIYAYTSINVSLEIFVEAKKSSIDNDSTNRKFQEKFHHFSGLQIRA